MKTPLKEIEQNKDQPSNRFSNLSALYPTKEESDESDEYAWNSDAPANIPHIHSYIKRAVIHGMHWQKSKLSPLSDEREKVEAVTEKPSDHIPQSGKMVEGIAEREELSEEEKWLLMVRFVKWYGNNAVDSKYMKDVLSNYEIREIIKNK